MWEDAHKASVTEPAHVKAAFLLSVIGPRIAAAALGLSDARQLRRWAAGETEPREHQVAVRLVRSLLDSARRRGLLFALGRRPVPAVGKSAAR